MPDDLKAFDSNNGSTDIHPDIDFKWTTTHTIIAITIGFPLLILMALWKSGALTSSAESMIAIASVAMTSLTAVIGVLVKYAIDSQNIRIKEAEQKRLDLEASIQSLKLLTTSSGDEAPRTQKAGVLFSLVHLNQLDLALSLVNQMLQYKPPRIDHHTACWVIVEALNSNDSTRQNVAANILDDNIASFIDRTTSDYSFPECYLDKSYSSYSAGVRYRISKALLTLFLMCQRDMWIPDRLNGLVVQAYEGWKAETDETLKTNIGSCLIPVLRMYPSGGSIVRFTETLYPCDIANEIQSYIRDKQVIQLEQFKAIELHLVCWARGQRLADIFGNCLPNK